jgi:hypothetical protein
MKTGKTVSAEITVKNVSPVTWPSKPDKKNRYAVNLSYHWLNQKGATVVFDGVRTPLPRDLKPGESVNLKAAIQAPAKTRTVYSGGYISSGKFGVVSREKWRQARGPGNRV